MFKYFSIAILMTGLLSGCATIVGEPTQMLPIKSSPDGASVVITDETGAQVFKGTTPTSVTLSKSDGTYFGKKEYKAVIKKPGYATFELPIKSSANGWYIGGNLVFGGLIGYLIVDPLSGNMYTLSVKEINAELSPETASHSLEPGSVNVVLYNDVPADLKAKMVKIN